jgi:aminomethyltransferase
VKRTPLYDEHVAAGARMVDFAGWQMPVQYDSIVAEHLGVRASAGLFDVSHMGEIFFSGAGAEQVCARLFTNDARALAPGRAQYSLIANEQGGVVDDVIVYRLDVDRFLVCVNASNIDKDREWILSHAGEDCTIADQSDQFALIAVQGPEAAGILAILNSQAPALGRFSCAQLELSSGSQRARALVARTGYTGEDGFELFVATEAAVPVWRMLSAAGKPRGLAPVGLGARDTLRLEAALPLYGHELADDISPYEAGLGWTVKLGRPNMVGYGALLAANERGAKRRLVGLRIEGGIARAQCPVISCGKRIGGVTSGSHCPTIGSAVALALIDREASTSDLSVEIRGKLRRATLADTPFYKRDAS